MSDNVQTQEGNGSGPFGTMLKKTRTKRPRVARQIGVPQPISEVPPPLKGKPTDSLSLLQPGYSLVVVGYSTITTRKTANRAWGPDEKIVLQKESTGGIRIWRLQM